MVDIQHRHLAKPGVDEERKRFRGDLVARLGEDLAGRRAVDIGRDILAVEVLVLRPEELDAAVGQLARGAGGQLLAGLEDHFARVGVEQIHRGLQSFHTFGVEGLPPAVLVADKVDRAIECGQDFLTVHAERIEHEVAGILRRRSIRA